MSAGSVWETLAAEGRSQLLEPEVYGLLGQLGIGVPRHLVVPPGEHPSAEALASLGSERVVIKLVSPEIVRKTEAGAVAFAPNEPPTIAAVVDDMLRRHAESDVRGVLIAERVQADSSGFGAELLVGLLASREFGPVLAVGVGGTDAEYFAEHLDGAVTRALALETTGRQVLDQLRRSPSYAALSGAARGRGRVVEDGALVELFDAFLALARERFVAREDGLCLRELEVNPFVIVGGRPVALDGRGRTTDLAAPVAARPADAVDRLLAPRSAAVIGVSAKAVNFGRIISRNLQGGGFDASRLWLIKPGVESIDGLPCVESVSALPEPVDVLVVATAASQLPALVDEIVDSGKARSAILIPGGVGERDGTGDTAAAVRAAIARGRAGGGGPVFMGPNSLGLIARPARFDTFFIPHSHLDRAWDRPQRPLAIVSQSGAFAASRLSNRPELGAAYALSIGNQIDLCISDYVAGLGRREDIEVVGVYAEGFGDGDGLDTARAVAELRRAGREVVFYKAGRSESGRAAAAGHTAAVAGDYAVFEAALTRAGALVTDSFEDWTDLLELGLGLRGKVARGLRLGVISNAGYETVGVSDALDGLELAVLDDAESRALEDSLRAAHIAQLVNPRNPLDLTPMATEAAFEAALRLMLDSPHVDALVVAHIPLTAALRTVSDGDVPEASLVATLPPLAAASDKPVAWVVDSGPQYEPSRRALRAAGLPVFQSADRATRLLSRWLRAHLEGAS